MFHSELCAAEVSISNYRVHRVDRQIGKGGGSCLYVHDSLQSEEICINVPDCLAVKLFNCYFQIIVLVVYRPPSQSINECTVMINKLSDQIKSWSIENELIIMGDFNLPDLSWDSGVIRCPDNTTDKNYVIQQMCLDFFVKHNFSWALGDATPTRRRKVLNRMQEATLDNVLVSDKNMLHEVEVTAPLGKSDHVGILTKIQVSDCSPYLSYEKRNWSKFTPAEILRVAETVSWSYDEKDKLDVNGMWDSLHSKLMNITQNVPMKKLHFTHGGALKVKSAWDKPHLVKARKMKEKCWATFENFPTATNYAVASEHQRRFDKQTQKAMINFENKATSNLKTNPKAFYSYMNSKRKTRSAISGIKNSKGDTLFEAEDIADELGKFFESTFVTESSQDIPFMAPMNANEITDLEFSSDQVHKYLEKVNVSKSQGPDEIHPKLLKTLAIRPDFVEMVTELFQKCYDSGALPMVWKEASITAIHKKGEKSKANNYRPISLTCILSKIYEKFLRNHILDFITPFLRNEQHGFLPGKSCVSNLLECMDKVYETLARGECVDILYLDFQKAFDSVPHLRLLNKIEACGVTGKTLLTIKDFLANRTFTVRIGETHSRSFRVTSGVPQGTVLGPLLFLIFINDLPGGMKSFISLFADDLKLVTSCSQHSSAQHDINELNKWEKEWLLSFNVKDGKCKVMHIGKKNPKNAYIMNEEVLPTTNTEKDLGVTTSCDLKWGPHITQAVNKAKAAIGWISRNLICRNKFVMLNVYKTLIRPHIEYAVQVWNLPAIHGNWKSIMELEDIQRSFTRMIDGIGLLPYCERLKKLRLTTLLERRMRGDLIETYKIISGQVEYGKNLFNISRSGAKILKDSSSDQNLRNRVANYWNKIPESVKDAPSVEVFKSRLEVFKKNSIEEEKTTGNYWELSDLLLTRINDTNREAYTDFMKSNPEIAKIKKVNVNPI